MNSTRFGEMKKTLEGRWKKDWSQEPFLIPVARAFRRSLDAVTLMKAKGSDLRATGKYSDVGLKEELRKCAASLAVPVLKEASENLEGVASEIAKRKALLTISPADPTNAAQAIVRSEMRTWLRSQPQAQALQVLLAENVDDQMLQAVFEAPPIISGLTDEMRQAVQKAVIQRKYGLELAKLEIMEECLTQGCSALQICVYELRQEVLFRNDDDAGFDKWMEEATAAAKIEELAKPMEERLSFVSETIDEVFARAFPQLYPDHPANMPLG